MFIALDKLKNQGLRQAIIGVPEKTISASFSDVSLSRFGFWTDWTVRPKWNLCSAPWATMGSALERHAAGQVALAVRATDQDVATGVLTGQPTTI